MKYLKYGFISLLIACIAIFVYDQLKPTEKVVIHKTESPSPSSFFKNVNDQNITVESTGDLIHAAKVATPTVVFVRSLTDADYNEWQTSYTRSSGSGVLISDDGYIVTNQHLIEQSNDIEVILNDRREFKAEIIGSDEKTDLALLKIEANNLPSINFSNSNDIQVGEWVIAVGNPFRMQSTVTAGIVSAKARDIPFSNSKNSVNSYIQTDAAVNQGNSGGPLVNKEGKLIGINTAIVTQSGRYEGYSFAIPSNVVLKVIEDIREYGAVHRGLLGIDAESVNADIAKAKDLDEVKGVYINEILPNSAADEGNLRVGDIILALNNRSISTYPELKEIMGIYRPGDTVEVDVFRNNSIEQISIELKNKLNSTVIVPTEKSSMFKNLGFEARNLTTSEQKEVETDGVKVISIISGSKIARTKMDPGFIITKINDQAVSNTDDLEKILNSMEGKIVLEGVYERYEGSFWYVFNK